MSINKITIEKVKGISSKSFELSMIPNKPSLLVAPNGFGKSSFAAAFMSMQSNKLSVQEEHLHQNNPNHTSRLIIEYTDDLGSTHTLEANETINSIHNHFDYFVINNQLKAKGIGRNFGGRTSVSASIAVEPVVLIDTIPESTSFSYSYTSQKQQFGANGKVLPNISNLFSNKPFIQKLSDKYNSLDRIQLVRAQDSISEVKQALNIQNGTANSLLEWLEANKLHELESIVQLKDVADLISESNLGIDSLTLAYLAALQISTLYHQDKPAFKKACQYNNYKLEKESYAEMLQAFNTSWQTIVPREEGSKLVVKFPKANLISNGQRDVITFVAMLFKAQKKLKKQNSILIIDEVFDYLDDANLVAVQYYITKFINFYKENGKKIYPLILTHLNPYYFKNFAFSKQKVYFLDKRDITADEGMVKLLRNRNNETIKDDVSKFLLHFHTDQINKRSEFRNLGLRETWGESNNFDTFVDGEVAKYLADQNDFDPLAVCCSVRKKIEKITYEKIINESHRIEFLETFKTRNKLVYAETKGVQVSEYFYLLGIIYNDGMHWREGQDNISPIAAKLENQTIRNLILELISM